MRMMRASFAAALVLSCAAAPLAAQDSAPAASGAAVTGAAMQAAAPFRPAPLEAWQAELPADAPRRAVLSGRAPHLSRSGKEGAVWGALVGGVLGVWFGSKLHVLCDSDPCGSQAEDMFNVGVIGVLGGAVIGYGVGVITGSAHQPQERPQ